MTKSSAFPRLGGNSTRIDSNKSDAATRVDDARLPAKVLCASLHAADTSHDYY